jgi:outer membrane protein OmpA-like peptidoglycan-associated protein
MDLAGKSIGQHQGLRTLVILDSGLSTAGALNFTEPGMLDADPQDVATTLADSRLLPDLTGVGVVFQGLGETVAPQEPLDRARRTQLQNIWTAVAKKAGAVVVQVEPSSKNDEPAADLPPVTPVTLGAGYECRPGQMVLTGGSLGFKPGSGEFLDPEAAVKVLRPIVEQVLSNDIAADMFGTDATVGEPGERRRLSEARAQTVADTFIGFGVPVSQLRVEGRGSDFEGLVPDRDSFDRVIPAAAAMNRKVIIEFDGEVRCP